MIRANGARDARTPARHRPEDKRNQLIEAAGSVFLAKGYSATTVDEVARQAGMSKKTVYQIFESKLALFDALVERRIFDIPVALPEESDDREGALSRLLLTFAHALLSPERVAVMRLLVAEGDAAPDLRRTFERLEMSRDLNLLESWVKREGDAGRLVVDDVRAAARLLFGMTIAERLLRRLVDSDSQAAREELEPTIRQGVAIFIRAFSPARTRSRRPPPRHPKP